MRANLLVSLSVAITGIGAPIGLSFILKDLVSASSLQAFAAGAALCATSLGTTFKILSTTNLIATRLGTVITSAAMLDDVVGLVMVQIILNLGESASSFRAVTVLRPVFVSIGFAVGLFLLSAFCFKPILKRMLASKKKMPCFMSTMDFAFLAQAGLLTGIIAGASYAGTSSLFAAYLVGLIVSWFDELVAEPKVLATLTTASISHDGGSPSNEQVSNPQEENQRSQQNTNEHLSSTPSTFQQSSRGDQGPTGQSVYERYYKEPVNRILLPLFFVNLPSLWLYSLC